MEARGAEAAVLRRRPLVELYMADCIGVMRAMRDKSVHSIVTDPPYGINYQNKSAVKRRAKIVNDDRPFIWWLRDAYRVLKPGGGLICFCRWDVQEAFKFAIELAGFKVKSQVVWDRKMHGMGDCGSTFAPQHDVMWFATRGRFKFPGGRPKSVLSVRSVVGAKRLHPTEKPVDLMRMLVKAITPPGGRVLDPFMGCGPTGEVCVADRFGFTDFSATLIKTFSEERFSIKGRSRNSRCWAIFEF